MANLVDWMVEQMGCGFQHSWIEICSLSHHLTIPQILTLIMHKIQKYGKRKVLTLIVHKSHALQTESTDDEVDGRAGGGQESLSLVTTWRHQTLLLREHSRGSQSGEILDNREDE